MHEPKRPPLAPPDLEADTLAAKLRGYEPEIEDLLKRRIRRAVIKDLLAQQGIEVSLNYLSVFMSRQRRRGREAERLVKPAVPTSGPEPRTELARPTSRAADQPTSEANASSGADSDLLEAALDPRRRAEKADLYINKHRSVIGRSLKDYSE